MKTDLSRTSDYPEPRAIQETEEMIWNDDDLAVINYCALGKRLAASGDLYRRPAYAGGLLLASDHAKIEPLIIDTGGRSFRTSSA